MSANALQRGHVVKEIATSIKAEQCCACGVWFGIEASMEKWLVNDPDTWFYCPNGHPQHYTGKLDDLDEAKRRAEQAEAVRVQLEDQLRAAHSEVRQVRSSNAALKGVVTKTKLRVGNGVCPCCNRSFAEPREAHAPRASRVCG